MSTFKNVHGQEPSPPLPQDHPVSVPGKIGNRQIPGVSRFMQRHGFEAIDLNQCQAPVNIGDNQHLRCSNPAVSVAVENEERDGRIAAYAVCAFHRDVLAKHAPNQANLTPIPLDLGSIVREARSRKT